MPTRSPSCTEGLYAHLSFLNHLFAALFYTALTWRLQNAEAPNMNLNNLDACLCGNTRTPAPTRPQTAGTYFDRRIPSCRITLYEAMPALHKPHAVWTAPPYRRTAIALEQLYTIPSIQQLTQISTLWSTEAIRKLMQQAWANEPDDRPTFQDAMQGMWFFEGLSFFRLA